MNTTEPTKLIEQLTPEVVSLRRDIHMYPELSFEEHRTSQLICDYLTKVGIKCQRAAKTGVVGTIMIKEAYPTIAVRAEMDAVPIQEQNQCGYASKNDGVMHACSHDGIVAIALGLANILSNLKERLKCNVKFLFQPAEEKGPGARTMIEEGVLENPKVDTIIIYHLNNFAPIGISMVRTTPTAAVGSLTVKISGKSSHWAERKKGINAIVIAARVILAIEEFNETYESKTPFVVGVGTINGGTRTSIIPDSAELKCSLRSISREEQFKICDCLKDKLDKIAVESNAKIDIQLNPGIPPIKNDPYLFEIARGIGNRVFGANRVRVTETTPLAGDDAAFFFEKIPGVKLTFCAAFEDRENCPIHSPKFDFNDEEIIPLALRTLYDLITKIQSDSIPFA